MVPYHLNFVHLSKPIYQHLENIQSNSLTFGTKSAFQAATLATS
jgi:hypothetical protein